MVGYRDVAVAALLAMVAPACGGTPAAPGEVPYGQRFDLRAGDTTTVGDDGLSVTFQAVKTDSRCPMDAICIDAGDAVAAFRFAVDGTAIARDLHTRTGQATTRIDRYEASLLSLLPYPQSGKVVAPGDYVAQLKIDRR